MSESSIPWRSSASFLIARPDAPALLLLPGESGWQLPAITLEQHIWHPRVATVLPALHDLLGTTPTILRCAEARTDEPARQVQLRYVAELPSSAAPAASRWLGSAELAELPLAQPEQRPLLLTHLDELAAAPRPPLRPPWAYPGWYQEAVAWIKTQLDGLGHTLHAPIEQIKCWGLSCILRAQTDAGPLYFKVAARLPLFADEPRIIAALATRYPQLVPTPLAIDHERGWMLLADLGTELRDLPDLALWIDALSAYGRMQRSAAEDVDWLRANGCIDRRLERLAAQIDPLLDSHEVRAALSADELERLRTIAPLLRARCAELDSYGLPPSLVHGDLHGGNIATKDGRRAIFDWTDACVAHPFLDLPTMMGDIREMMPDPSAPDQLRDRYLEQWTDIAPIERLRAAWALTTPLATLHQAVSYQSIVANVEPAEHATLGWGVSYWLRETLKLIEAETHAAGPDA